MIKNYSEFETKAKALLDVITKNTTMNELFGLEKTITNIEKVNEEVVDDINTIKNIIEKTGQEIYVWGHNDRIFIKYNGHDCFNTNNNTQGAQAVVTFLYGLLEGIVQKKK